MTTTEDHDFAAFMAKLPQWAQAHVHRLEREVDNLKHQVQLLEKDIETEGQDATVWLCSVDIGDVDKPLNGTRARLGSAPVHTRVRFSDNAKHTWAGLRVGWADRHKVQRDGEWLEVTAGNGSIEMRASSANVIYVREAQ